MSSLTDRVVEAQKYALSIRPKIGGFPVLAEVLKRAGIYRNRWSLPSCESVYFLKEGSVIQQGTPLVTGIHDIPSFDQDALIAALRKDQEGRGTFPEFLLSAWQAGVIAYEVDFIGRSVVYYGARGERYVEDYPAVPESLIR